jgi:prepilin-type N-terminal cleavage/methylation domain-containing protein
VVSPDGSLLHRPRRTRATARGFTLIELVVVVVIISVLAVLAVPSVTERMRERRSSQAAQEISTLYRNARMRALGRGSAVLVRYQNAGFRVLEAVEGTAAAVARGGSVACQPLPTSGCVSNDWGPTGTFRVVSEFNPAIRGEFKDVTTTVRNVEDEMATYLDVCFSPLGRSFSRTASGVPLTPMTGVVSVSVKRPTGLERTVVVLPNGIARLAESGG